MSITEQKEKLKTKAQWLIEKAKKYAPFVFVTLTDTHSALTRFGENEITQNVGQSDFSADITLSLDKKSTKLQVDSLDEEKLDKMFAKALEILNYQKPDKNFPEFAKNEKYEETTQSFDEKTAYMKPDERAEKVIKVIEMAEKENLISSGIVKNGFNSLAIADSDGLFAYSDNSFVEISLTVMDDKGCSGWAEASSWNVDNIDFEKIGETAVKKALLSKEPQDIEPGEYTVILEPGACADFLLFLSFMGFSTESYYEGENPFKNQLNTKVLSDKITIKDNPYNDINPGLPFDFEGNKRQVLTPVENGVFNELPLDYKWAEKTGKTSTGHALPYPNSHGPECLNLQLMPGEKNLNEIIKESDNCLLITHFHYTNVINSNNLTITGMTRDGVYMIKNGEIAYPVNNLRFTESIVRALNNVEQVSSEQVFQSGFFGGGFILPGLKINNFKFTSTGM
ncbi:MAG: TldD/PmbA family protein [Candidatus Muiribacteriota bacterium]